jgi:hypothetical protein
MISLATPETGAVIGTGRGIVIVIAVGIAATVTEEMLAVRLEGMITGNPMRSGELIAALRGANARGLVPVLGLEAARGLDHVLAALAAPAVVLVHVPSHPQPLIRLRARWADP